MRASEVWRKGSAEEEDGGKWWEFTEAGVQGRKPRSREECCPGKQQCLSRRWLWGMSSQKRTLANHSKIPTGKSGMQQEESWGLYQTCENSQVSAATNGTKDISTSICVGRWHWELDPPGTLEWLSGWASAFGSGHDPRVLGLSPPLDSLWGARFSLCLCFCFSLYVSHE